MGQQKTPNELVRERITTHPGSARDGWAALATFDELVAALAKAEEQIKALEAKLREAGMPFFGGGVSEEWARDADRFIRAYGLQPQFGKYRREVVGRRGLTA